MRTYTKYSVHFFAGILLLAGCESGTEFRPVYPEHARFEVTSTMLAYTAISGRSEKLGTNIQISTTNDFSRSPQMFTWSRHHDSTRARGWNKGLLAHALQRKVDVTVSLDSSLAVRQVSGFDSTRTVLGRLSLTDKLHRRLAAVIDTQFYKDEISDRWALFGFLRPGVYQPGQLLDIEPLRQSLKTIIPDSVQTGAARMRQGRQCLEFSLFYHVTRDVSLEMEQFFVSFQKELDTLQFSSQRYHELDDQFGMRVKPNLWNSREMAGRWRISLDMDTGLPCYEYRFESAAIPLTDEFTHDEARILLHNYHEYVYRPL